MKKLVLLLLLPISLCAQTIRPTFISQLRLTQLTTAQEGTMTLQEGDIWENITIGCIRYRLAASTVCIAQTGSVAGTAVITNPTANQSIAGPFNLTLDGNFLLSTIGQDLCSSSIRCDFFARTLDVSTTSILTGNITFGASILPSVTGQDIGSASVRPDAFLETVTTGILNNIRVVDGNKFTTIQAALDDAGAIVVIVPDNYAGAEETTVGATQVILDFRGGRLRIRGKGVVGAFSALGGYSGSSSTDSLQTIILGSSSAPSTIGDAPLIVQKFSSLTGEAGAQINPAIYGAAAKSTTASLDRVTGIYGVAVDNAGGTGGFVEGGRFAASLASDTGGATSAYGVVAAATALAAIDYVFLIPVEADILNSSGTDAPAIFTSAKFAANFLASATSTVANGRIDAAFMVNPFNSTQAAPWVGFMVPSGSLNTAAGGAAIRVEATTEIGLDLRQGTFAFASIVIPNTSAISARNNADNATHNMLFYNSADAVVLGTDTTAVTSVPVFQPGAGVTLTGGVLEYNDAPTLAASTTPSVTGGNVFLTNSTASITDFTGEQNGQVIILLCGADTTTSLVDSTPLFLAGAFTCTADDTITLVSNGTVWFETSRSVN